MARWSKEKRESVRATILEVARDLFATKGFEGTTMRDVARAAELATGTVFNYFADKTELLHAALHDDLERVKEACVDSLPPAEAGLEAVLVHAGGAFFDYYAARPALSRALLSRSLLVGGEPGARFRGQVEAVAMAIGSRVREMQALGLVAPSAEIRDVVLAFLAHYYFVLLAELPGDPDPTRMRATLGVLVRQLLAGVGGAPEPTDGSPQLGG